ncbi:hypothetical protein KZ869_21600, partial [Pseudomonas aeruginosa]
MRRSLLFCGALLASLCAWAEPAQVRLLSSDFVLPGKHQRLAGWAREAGVESVSYTHLRAHETLR